MLGFFVFKKNWKKELAHAALNSHTKGGENKTGVLEVLT